MRSTTDIVGYTYRGDDFCPPCILEWCAGDPAVLAALGELTPQAVTAVLSEDHTAEELLDIAARERQIDRHNEATFDSGEFPKVLLRGQLDGDDHISRCGNCGTMLGSYW